MSLKTKRVPVLPLCIALIAAGAAVVSQLVPIPRSFTAGPGIMPAPEVVVDRGPRPQPIRERFEQERERTAVANLSGEGALDERDAYEQWFFEQRTFPGGALPVNAIGAAVDQARGRNKDLRGAPGGGGPMWKPLGPMTIPDGQTDATAGQLSPVSGRLNAIAVHPTNPDIAYAGGAQGGVWKSTNATSAKPTWVPLTDHEASLAVGSIAIDPANPDVVYVGTGEANRSCDSYYGQGILRSADGGATWTLLGGTPGSAFQNPGPFTGKAVARIVIDPDTAGTTSATTLWASTTIGVFSSGTIATCQSASAVPFGLWRSTDSGATWQLQNVPNPGAGGFGIQDLALDPTNSNILYAGVRTSGVWKSINAKAAVATFTRMGTGFPPVNSFVRINLGIGGPAGGPLGAAHNTVYAAIEANAGGDPLLGLYKSTNGGASWSNVDAGFHGAATGTNFVDTNPNGTTTTRIRVTRVTGPPFVTDGTWNTRRFIFNNATPLTIRRVESANTLVLNAAFGNPGTFGFTYSVGNYPRYCDGQCFYDMTVAVDPTDPDGNRVYVGGNPRAFAPNFAPNLNELLPPVTAHSHWRTDDGGLKWSSISQGDGTGASLHTDDHAWGFGANGSIYNGNDGGIWRSDDRGASWTSMNTDIVITQFQGLSLHPTNPNVVLGGTQDNGTNLRNPKVLAPPKWFHSDFGDGGVSVIDQSTPATMFHTYFNQSNNFMGPARTDNGGVDGPGSWPFVGAYAGYGGRYYNGMNPKDPVSFYAPMAQHPAFTPNVIYFGSNRVYRSANPQPFIFTDPPPATQPQSWTAVSPALTKNPAGTAYLSWIGVLPNLINGKEVLYTGASDGRLEATAAVDGSGIAAWTVLDKAPLPNRAVTQVLPVGGDPTGNTAYATFSGFDNATPATPGHVFKTTNGLGAATWTNITGDLPNIPVNQIVADPDDAATLYVGTDIGVFRTRDGGGHWVHLSNGLPNVTIFALQMDPQRNRVVASTHGRGMFELLSSGGPKAP